MVTLTTGVPGGNLEGTEKFESKPKWRMGEI